MRPEELTAELQATTTEAYKILVDRLCIPTDREKTYQPTQEEKKRMILLTAIRYHWTHNPSDLYMVILALTAYKCNFPNDYMPRESTVEFFVGPDAKGN